MAFRPLKQLSSFRLPSLEILEKAECPFGSFLFHHLLVWPTKYWNDVLWMYFRERFLNVKFNPLVHKHASTNKAKIASGRP